VTSGENQIRPPQETVLVVEDEVLIRYVISDYLRECGYKVIEASNADEALLVLQEGSIGVDVVLSNVQMPGSMDRFALARWLRANRVEVGVILVGSITRAADAAAELCEQGPMLSKPYEPRAVVDRIRRLLAERKRT
jgi:CheY-like chemotaxis protein